MTIDKFYNETFDFTLEVIVFDYSDKKEFEKIDSLLIKSGIDKSKVYELLTTAKAFCTNFTNTIQIVFDLNAFKKEKHKAKESLKTIAHECGHVRGFVLENIGEDIKTTDSEVYTRISDWAFKKCMSVKYFRKLLK